MGDWQVRPIAGMPEPVAVTLDPQKILRDLKHRKRILWKANIILSLIPKENVLTVVYEDLRNDSEKVLISILEFLNVQYHSAKVKSKIKKNMVKKHSEYISNYQEIVDLLRTTEFGCNIEN